MTSITFTAGVLYEERVSLGRNSSPERTGYMTAVGKGAFWWGIGGKLRGWCGAVAMRPCALQLCDHTSEIVRGRDGSAHRKRILEYGQEAVLEAFHVEELGVPAT